MTGLIGSMFSGYGGLDLATEALYGLNTGWHVENDPHASQVIAHHWPGVPNLGDVTAINWDIVAPVTVITAGFPCQDLSYAGLGAGIEGTRSGLWTHVADAVRTLRPQRLVVENVPALLTRGLGRVVGDLAEVGYDTEWGCVPAAAVGAPHRRDRFFLIAHPANPRSSGRDGGPAGNEPAVGGRDRLPAIGGEGVSVAARSTGPAADPDGDRLEGIEGPSTGWDTVRADLGHDADRRRMWGRYWPAIHRWETIIGRPAPHPTNQRGRLNPELPEWMMGLPAGWVTQVVESHTGQLRCLGNGVVSLQAYHALAELEARITSQAVAA